MEELKDLYDKILCLTQSLEYFIEKKNTKKIDELLEKRLEIVNIALKLKEEIGTNQEINELAAQIKTLDNKNFERLNALKNGVQKELYAISKNSKAVSAYKTPEQKRSRLVDETDA